MSGRNFLTYCTEEFERKNPGIAIDGVFMIGGHDTQSYHQLAQWIEDVRASRNSVTDFIRKIKSSSLTVNMRRRRAASDDREGKKGGDDETGSDLPDDHVSDCTLVYDRTSIPPKFFVAQRTGMDRAINGTSSITSPCVIYQIDAESGHVSATIYPALHKSRFPQTLLRTVRRNVSDPSSVAHCDFDLPDDDEHKILLSRVRRSSSNDPRPP